MAEKQNTALDEKNIRLFTKMIIQKMESIKANWEMPWISTKTKARPQNISGRNYEGANLLLLMMHQEEKGYQLPIYMTFPQAMEEGVNVKRGEKGFPVFYYYVTIRNRETGEKITNEEYDKLSKEEQKDYYIKGFKKYYTLFNIEQTSYAEVKKDKWEQLVARFSKPNLKDENDMVRCPDLDHIIKNQTWVCPIYTKNIDAAFFSSSKDEINIPNKQQFINGEEFYGTLLHEMAHSTGTEDRLNRNLKNPFGSEEYAHEELIAELTSAMIANEMGIYKTIEKNNVAYLKSWINSLSEKPDYLMNILSDVSRASNMILSNVSREQEKIKNEHLNNIQKFMEEKDKKMIVDNKPTSIGIKKIMDKETGEQQKLAKQENETQELKGNKNQEVVETTSSQEKKLHSAFLGNGISYWEDGDTEYTAHVSEDRSVSFYKDFSLSNKTKIETFARNGNWINNSQLVLNPINEPTKILENTTTGERYNLSIEEIDGEWYACHGRQTMRKGKEIDSLMDLIPKNIAMLDEIADKRLKDAADDLKIGFKSGNKGTIDQAIYNYLYATRYKMQEKYVHSDTMKEIEEIKNSLEIDHQDTLKKDSNMEENKPQKKVMRDGINIFKMDNGFYGINKVENGERTNTHQIKPEDIKAFFTATKDKSKDVRDVEATKLFDKYFNNKEQNTKTIKPFNKLDEVTKTRISDVSIFKMQDGYSYAVRAKIDGEQQSGVRINKQDVKAFFEGFKELSKEQQAERRIEIASIYYKNELSAAKEDISKGISR